MNQLAALPKIEEKPLYEKILAFPGQAILTIAALPVLAVILAVRGAVKLAAIVRARPAMRRDTRFEGTSQTAS